MIYIKTDEEINKMRKACKITGDVLKLLEDSIREGMTTKDLDKIAYDYIIGCGAKPAFLGLYGFPGTVCISIDEQVVHGIPSDKRIIKEGEIVSLDTGAVVDGWYGDAARSVYVGKISPEKKRLIDVTKECFFKGAAAVMEGAAIGDIGYAVQTYAESNGFSVVREMVGHGVGKHLHEDPSVPNYGKRGVGARIRKGMTLAIEPMINMGDYKVHIDGWDCITKDGLPSAHYENTVALTDNGVEILTL